MDNTKCKCKCKPKYIVDNKYLCGRCCPVDYRNGFHLIDIKLGEEDIRKRIISQFLYSFNNLIGMGNTDRYKELAIDKFDHQFKTSSKIQKRPIYDRMNFIFSHKVISTILSFSTDNPWDLSLVSVKWRECYEYDMRYLVSRHSYFKSGYIADKIYQTSGIPSNVHLIEILLSDKCNDDNLVCWSFSFPNSWISKIIELRPDLVEKLSERFIEMSKYSYLSDKIQLLKQLQF